VRPEPARAAGLDAHDAQARPPRGAEESAASRLERELERFDG